MGENRVFNHDNWVSINMQDSDVSIRRRALELVCALVNLTNVKTLTKELVDFLKVSDSEFKGDLTAKISGLVQKYLSFLFILSRSCQASLLW